MLAWLTDPLTSPVVQRALAEVLILAIACGPLGVWVLLYRDAYAAESLSHGMLPGLVLAALAGAPLVLGATGGVLVAAAGIALVGRDPRLGSEIGVAVVVSALLGLGGILALAPEAPPRLAELLFGDLLGVDGVSAARIEAVFAELRAEGRTLLVATHDVRQAAEWDRVLCLHRRQIEYGAPAAVLGPETLRETYGGELIVLPGGARAVGVGHHAH